MQLIKTVKKGECLPYGLSREWPGALIALRIPLFPWYGRSYRVSMDDFAVGWWVRDLYLRFGTANKLIRGESESRGGYGLG